MPNFNPMERNSLMNLMAALGSGMTGSTALTQFQNILNAQQGRVAANKERNGSLIDLLAGNASQGGSLQSARAIAGAYDPGKTLPPAIRDALGSLYPQDANGTPGTYDAQSGYHPGTSPIGPAQNMSPTYQPPQPTPQDALAYQQLAEIQQQQTNAPQVAQALAADWASDLGQIRASTGEPWTAEEIMADFVQSDAYANLDVYAQSQALTALQEMLQANAGKPVVDQSSGDHSAGDAWKWAIDKAKEAILP